VFETGRSTRIDNYADSCSGPIGVTAREAGINSSLATPIMVEGRLWGLIAAGSIQKQPVPADTEARLASFTELVATAIANAESRAALAASRARIVAAADAARRRIERDLHDGIQQRLVSLLLQLRLAESSVAAELEEARRTIGQVAGELNRVIDELREISCGIHPAIPKRSRTPPNTRTPPKSTSRSSSFP
jgi:signal transduction histidine kinase